MASSAKKIAWLTVPLGLALAPGCGPDDERFPPPQPAISSGAGAGNTTSAGGSGGSGGAGGATGGTGGVGGAVEPPNPCECVLSTITKASCQDCINASSNNECKTESTACTGDPACLGYSTCVATDCDDLPAEDKPACVQACVVGPKGEPAYHFYVDLLDCICGACAAQCAVAEPLACE